MNNKFKKEVVSGKCVDLSSEGKGVVKTEGKTIFVDGIFIGEEAEIEVSYSRAGVFFGKVLKLLTVSKDRVQPKCKVCTACGGCQFQQLSYKKQLEYKTNKVKNCLLRIAKIDTPVESCDGMDVPYNYRNKIQVPFGYDRSKKKIISGFYRAMSHEIIPIDACEIEDVRASKIIRTIKTLMPDFRLRPYDEDTGIGEVRHVLIRTSLKKNEIMVVLVMNCNTFAGRNNFVKALIGECPEVTTIVQNTNTRHTNVILGDKEETLYGKGFINDELCGLSFRISSKSFYQINPIQCEKLYRYAVIFAKLTKEDVVLDAYSGIGTIGLITAKECKEVLSVEIVNDAIKDGIKNARANNINNVRFINGDAGNYLLKAEENKQKIDVVFLDPPRSGSDEKFLNAILELKPSKVIYISCEPSTLARDLKLLNEKYRIEKVQPVDMFPQTFHVETVVLLVLKGSKK